MFIYFPFSFVCCCCLAGVGDKEERHHADYTADIRSVRFFVDCSPLFAAAAVGCGLLIFIPTFVCSCILMPG